MQTVTKVLLFVLAVASVVAAKSWSRYCGDFSCPNVALDIACTSPSSCYIAGGYSNTPMAVYKNVAGDLGNWELTDYGKGPVMTMAIDAHASGALAVGGLGVGNNSAIAASTDGNTFRASDLMYPLVGQDLKAIPNGATSPSQAAFGFVGQGMITGRDAVFFSSNGGKHFAPIYLPNATAQDFGGARYMSAVTANVWYVTAGIWPTTAESLAEDTLNHCYRASQHICQPLDERASPLEVRRVNTRNARVGADGYKGAIFKTSDAGKSFEIVSSVEGYYFNDIGCTDEKICVAVGEGSNESGIYRTVDGGKTWKQVYSQTSGFTSLMKIRFAADGKTAYAAGGNADATGLNGVILKSTDAGATWALDYKVPGVGIVMGLFVPADASYVAALGATNEQTSVIMVYQ